MTALIRKLVMVWRTLRGVQSEAIIPEGHRPLILLVEKDLGLRHALTEALTYDGYGVAAAENGEAALQWLHSAQPDLVILGLGEHDVNEWSFLKEYRARAAGTDAPPPLIMLSSVRVPSDYATTLGVRAYLAKPFDLDKLLEQVKVLTSDASGAPVQSGTTA